MSLEDKRQLYACGTKFTTLEQVETWSQQVPVSKTELQSGWFAVASLCWNLCYVPTHAHAPTHSHWFNDKLPGETGSSSFLMIHHHHHIHFKSQMNMN